MVGIELSGGLGNQFFRYAFARQLIFERGETESLLINKRHCHHHGSDGDIDSFNIYENHTSCNCRRLVLKYGHLNQKLLYAVYVFIPKILKFFQKDVFSIKIRLVILLRKFGLLVVNDPKDLTCLQANIEVDNIYALGNFENPYYFYSIRNILLKEFTPKLQLMEQNRAFYSKLQSSESVFIGIRRGDYTNSTNKETFLVCTLNYYKEAIEIINKKVNNPHFFIFSNDIGWCKSNLKIDGAVDYESGNNPVWETFRLMCGCKHFIISNSTFHWWAQYCSLNKDKIVICPSRWFANSEISYPLIEDTFIKISV